MKFTVMEPSGRPALPVFCAMALLSMVPVVRSVLMIFSLKVTGLFDRNNFV